MKRFAVNLCAVVAASSAASADPEFRQVNGKNAKLEPGATLSVSMICAPGQSVSAAGYQVAGSGPGVAIVPVENMPHYADGIGATGWRVTVLNASPEGSPAAAVSLDVRAVCQ